MAVLKICTVVRLRIRSLLIALQGLVREQNCSTKDVKCRQQDTFEEHMLRFKKSTDNGMCMRLIWFRHTWMQSFLHINHHEKDPHAADSVKLRPTNIGERPAKFEPARTTCPTTHKLLILAQKDMVHMRKNVFQAYLIMPRSVIHSLQIFHSCLDNILDFHYYHWSTFN